MFSIRHRASTACRTHLSAHPHLAASAFLSHTVHPACAPAFAPAAPWASTTRRIACAVHAFHSRAQMQAEDVEASSSALSSASDIPPSDPSSSSTPPARPNRAQRKFKLYAKPSERRAAIAAERAALLAEEQDRSRTARNLVNELNEEMGTDAGGNGAQQQSSIPGEKAPVVLGESQVRGILAKRAALQSIYPLRMLMTSPRQGLDKIRIIPPSLQRTLDGIIRSRNYLAGQNEVYQRKEYALWHVANRSAIEFGVLTRIFDELVKRVPGLDPYSVMDYGSATSMTYLALTEALQNYGLKIPGTDPAKLERPIRVYRPIESNSELAAFGSTLIQETTQQEGVEVRYRANLPPLPTPSSTTRLEQSSIVCAPFSLSLIEAPEKRYKVLETLWQSVAQGGVLVLVEGGSIEAFDLLRQAREHLLESHGLRSAAQRSIPGSAETAAYVVAPCGSNGVCPLGDKSLKRSCWHRAEILTSSLPLRMPGKHMRSTDGVTVETFSYLIVRKGRNEVGREDARRLIEQLWKPKEKDLHEVGQQGWQAKAREESLEMQERLDEQTEREEREAAREAMTEEGRAKDDASSAVPDSVPFIPFGSDPSQSIPQARAVGSEMPLPTKRTDLAQVAHLLPSLVEPNVMFEHAYSRIIRKPLKRGEHVVLDLCNEESKLERRVIAKSWGVPYTLARAVSEGDLWPVKPRPKDPNALPNAGDRRRAAVKERREKRQARLAELDEEDRILAQQELNATKAASRKEREDARKEKHQAEKDAMILARGGTVPDRQKEKREKEEAEARKAQGAGAGEQREEIIFVDEDAADLDPLVEAQLQKARLPDVPLTREQKLEQRKAQRKKEAEETAATAEGSELTDPSIEATSDAVDDTTAAAQPEPDAASAAFDSMISETTPPTSATKKKKKKASSADAADAAAPATDKQKKPKKKSSSSSSGPLLHTGGTSRMPAWMSSILSDTKKVEGGGLEYVGKANQKTKRRPSDDEREDEEGEYVFPPDPTLVRAATAGSGGVPPGGRPEFSTQSDEELQELARREWEKAVARKMSEKEKREASPLNTQAVSSAQSTKTPKSKQPRQAKSATATTAKEASEPVATRRTAPEIAESDEKPFPPASRIVAPQSAKEPTKMAEPKQAAASKPAAETTHAPSTPAPSSTAASPAASDASTPSSLARPPRAPKWSKYRPIKSATPTPATPENTAYWPDDSPDAERNILNLGREEWQRRKEREKEERKELAMQRWYKRMEVRKQRDVKANERAASSIPDGPPSSAAAPTPSPSSTLPPHLAALRAAALASPRNSDVVRAQARMRQKREEFEERYRGAGAGERRSDRDPTKRRERNQHGREARQGFGGRGIAKRPRSTSQRD